MKQVYPIIITKDTDFYVVYVPDFDINTQGETMPEAMEMARDAIGMCGCYYEDEGKVIPEPSELTQVHADGKSTITLVDVDFSEYRRKNEMRVVKKNCTIPSWLNYEAEKAHINFSSVLQEALKKELNIQR